MADLFSQRNTGKINTSELLSANDCILFQGDNLASLESISSACNKSVDLIYIDPPYNTGTKMMYNDSRISKGEDLMGQHSEWMSFIGQRLWESKRLLKDTGHIVVSIDDYEQPYLRVLLDKVYGSKNFVANIVVERSKNGKGARKSVATSHEYLVVYQASSAAKAAGFPECSDSYNLSDEHGRYRIDGMFRKKGADSRRSDRPNMFYPLYYDERGVVFTEPAEGRLQALPLDSKGVERRWLWGKETADQNSWRLYASPRGTIYVKNYYSPDKRTKVRSIWSGNGGYYTDTATTEIKALFGEKIFDTPKPMVLLEDVLTAFSGDESVILDFFAGSGTTAHAAENLRRKYGENRKIILMEHDSAIPTSHAAFEAGFRKMCDITVARLEKIQKLNPEYRFELLVDNHFQSPELPKTSGSKG